MTIDFKAWRLRQGMTQEEVARAIGVTLRSVQHWEKGTIIVPGYALRLMSAIDSGADVTEWSDVRLSAPRRCA